MKAKITTVINRSNSNVYKNIIKGTYKRNSKEKYIKKSSNKKNSKNKKICK
jgi:hypothetical protein